MEIINLHKDSERVTKLGIRQIYILDDFMIVGATANTKKGHLTFMPHAHNTDDYCGHGFKPSPGHGNFFQLIFPNPP